MEKKAVLDVLESIMSNMEWPVKNQKEYIEIYENGWKEEQENAKAEEREPNPDFDHYDRLRAENAKAWLSAYETVKKHLEKLI